MKAIDESNTSHFSPGMSHSLLICVCISTSGSSFKRRPNVEVASGLDSKRREGRRRLEAGGEGGIRTLGTGFSPCNCLAGSPVRPLRHLSPFEELDCIARALEA